VEAVAVSSDGARLATASDDGSVRVFDVVTGVELARLDHDATVVTVAFCLDGRRVATGSRDGSARVFDAVTGVELARLDHDATVAAVAFAPDGAHVATASYDSSARVFEADSTALVRRAIEVMTRPLRPIELRRHLLPWNCHHREQWLRRQATAGEIEAAWELVDVLLSRRTDDQLCEAETWCRRLTAHGKTDIHAALGAIAVRRGHYNQAIALWRQAAADGDARTVLKLAAIEAVRGNPQGALTLLGSAAASGHKQATAYAAIINQTITDIHLRQLETAADSGNTDALNFIGLATFQDSKTSITIDYWTRSAELGDWVAPFLLTHIGHAEP
jgi:WD40 repeat protein